MQTVASAVRRRGAVTGSPVPPGFDCVDRAELSDLPDCTDTDMIAHFLTGTGRLDFNSYR
ncbi:MAG TPA: hypothetical protein VII33_07730 [Nakamurella sp.]